MKRFSFLFVLTLLVGLSACNKVDYPATLDLIGIVEKSEIKVYTASGEIPSEGVSFVNDAIFSSDYEEDGITKIVFEDDENVTITALGETSSATYTKEDDAIAFTIPIPELAGLSFSTIGTGDEEALTIDGVAYIQGDGNFSISSANYVETVNSLRDELVDGDTLAVQTFKYDYVK